MQEILPQLLEMQVDTIVITMSKPKAIESFLREYPQPFPLYGNPSLTLYIAVGFGRTSWLNFFRPTVVWKYLKMIFQGFRVRAIAEGEDALQLGGDLLFSPEAGIEWCYASKDAVDRPSNEEILMISRAQAK
ncbi:MAG: peroxiredoxin-like family protein [Zavarzinella sp.]